MERAFRLIKRITLIVGLVLLLAIPVIGLASTAINYRGICYGFTDGQAPCAWWQFAGREISWAVFIFIPYLFLTTLAWLSMALIEFVISLRKRNKPASH